jgi:hypothetical protein
VFAVFLLIWPSVAFGQANTVFSGVPSVKIGESGVERKIDNLERATAVNVACVISEIGGRYYWASRENKELVRMESGAFTTFIAVDGAGYVRVLDPDMKNAAAMMWPSAKAFDYVEHFLTGLDSVTYYGTARR